MTMFDFEEESLANPKKLANYMKSREKKASVKPAPITESSKKENPDETFEQKEQARCDSVVIQIVTIEVVLIILSYILLFAINDIFLLFAIAATPVIITLFTIILGIAWFQYSDYNTHRVKRFFQLHLLAMVLTFFFGWSWLENMSWS